MTAPYLGPDRRTLRAVGRRVDEARWNDRRQQDAQDLVAGPYRAVEWACHAPTTVVRGEGPSQMIIAECSGNGMTSHWNASIARRIAAALNAAGNLSTEQLEALGAGSMQGLVEHVIPASRAAEMALAKATPAGLFEGSALQRVRKALATIGGMA